MPAVVVEALRQHRQHQDQDRRTAGDGWVETGLVFATAGGRHIEPRNLSTAYGRLLAQAKVRPIRFHDLRHTCATLLLGMPAMQQEAAGHIDAARGDEEDQVDAETEGEPEGGRG